MNWSSAARGWRRIALPGAVLTALAVPSGAGAQRNVCSARHPMVDAVEFSGNHAVPSGDIAPLIAVERTSLFRRWFGWDVGAQTCLDSVEVTTDTRRIALVYARRGYPGTNVTARISLRGDRRAQVRFMIREAPPLRIREVLIAGLPADGADSAGLRARLTGAVYNDSVVRAVADSVHSTLRNNGYARAGVTHLEAVADTATRAVVVRLGFEAGHITKVGAIHVAIAPSGDAPALGEDAVRSLLRLRSGETFSARRVGTSQRDLYALELYKSIKVDTGAVGDSARDDAIPITVSLIEGDRERVRVGGGWGTNDCFRTQARFLEQNFLRSGHRLELTTKLSKLGVGEPFTGLKSLCAPQVRDDPFSRDMGYYVGATTNLRGLLGTGYRPELSVFSERRSEISAYEQTTDIGVLASVSRELAPRLEARVNYSFVNAKTSADRAVSCTKFGFCRLEDVTSFVLRTPTHGVSFSLTSNPLLPTDDPVIGERWHVETKYGHASVGQLVPLDFARVQGEFAIYRPVSELLTLAARVSAGWIVEPADRSFLLPPPERFYGGGQNSVRGYGQNLLGPGSYIVTSIDTVTGPGGTTIGRVRTDSKYFISPSGGNATWVANLELRTTRGWPNDLLRWVLFVDAGQVWNTQQLFSVTNAASRVTPGLGLRLATPLGPFRLDIGYNPNDPDVGPAFLVVPRDATTGAPGRAICVSEGTDDPLVLRSGAQPSSNSCPATFLPIRSTSLLSRLTFNFSLGHAF